LEGAQPNGSAAAGTADVLSRLLSARSAKHDAAPSQRTNYQPAGAAYWSAPIRAIRV